VKKKFNISYKQQKKKNMSSRFESTNLIKVYEINGTEEKRLKSDQSKIKVREHWNRKEFVVIEIDDKKMTVLANELKRAINNAQNAHRY